MRPVRASASPSESVDARDDERAAGPERRVVVRVAEARAAADVEVVAGEGPEVDEAVGAVVLNGCERATVWADRRRWTEVARADARVERASEAPVADEVPGDDAAVEAGGVERARPAVDGRRHDSPRVAAEDLTRRGLLDVPQDGRPVIAGGHQEASVGREDGTLYGTLVAAGRSGLTARPEIEEADRSVIAADRERPAVRRDRAREGEPRELPQRLQRVRVANGDLAIPGVDHDADLLPRDHGGARGGDQRLAVRRERESVGERARRPAEPDRVAERPAGAGIEAQPGAGDRPDPRRPSSS